MRHSSFVFRFFKKPKRGGAVPTANGTNKKNKPLQIPKKQICPLIVWYFPGDAPSVTNVFFHEIAGTHFIITPNVFSARAMYVLFHLLANGFLVLLMFLMRLSRA